MPMKLRITVQLYAKSYYIVRVVCTLGLGLVDQIGSYAPIFTHKNTTVLLILTKLSSSHCLPNFCQKFTRRFPVFTKSGENLSIHALRAHYVA